MGLTVGRSKDITTEVESVSSSGDALSLAGDIDPSDSYDGKAFAQMLRGLLANPDEDAVPVVWSEDSDVDGLYRVVGGSLGMPQVGLTSGLRNWSLELERVPDSAFPSVEVVLVGGFRANGLSFTSASATPWMGVPDAAYDFYDGENGVAGGFVGTRESETGDVGIAASWTTGLARRVAQFSLAPSAWYNGAARLDRSYNGTYYPIVGRQYPTGLSGATASWRLDNGLMRLWMDTSGTIYSQFYDGATWGTATETYNLSGFDGTSAYSVDRTGGISILRNSPVEVRIRVSVGVSAGGAEYPMRSYLDISLKRGAHHAEIRWTSLGPDAWLGKLASNSASAGTNLTGYIVSVTPDADGNRLVILSSSNGSYATGAGSISIDTTGASYRATAVSFGIGWEKDGSSGTSGLDRATDIQDQYFGPSTETQRVVAR